MNITLQLIRDEGVKLEPYMDCCGKPYKQCDCAERGNLTIGIGTNLEGGITHNEAMLLCDQRLKKARLEISSAFPWTTGLDDVRYNVLVNLHYNMGLKRLSTFKKMLAALEAYEYHTASLELLDSNYARGVHKARAERLAVQLRTGTEQ